MSPSEMRELADQCDALAYNYGDPTCCATFAISLVNGVTGEHAGA